jgi:hypothetical protein
MGVTGVSIWILFASACRPFHKLWQILPDPGSELIHHPVRGFRLTILRILHAAKPRILNHSSGIEPRDRHVHHPYSDPNHSSSEDLLWPQVRASAHVWRRRIRHDRRNLTSVFRHGGKLLLPQPYFSNLTKVSAA